MMDYSPPIREDEAEKASFAYLMSTIVLIVGLPMPIINMIATVIFYLANRRRSYFVRFHCLQSMLSQMLIVAMNSVGVWWTISILLDRKPLSNYYIAYIIIILVINIMEFVASLYAAVQTRKGIDVRFWFFGTLTEVVCRKDRPDIYTVNP
ncbi:MAG: DUF4870 domain-containing protein [Tannerellaceae bacterium]|jgi:uncharacterized membrane protein|nr:DUF4870 domain-containing protein [Tannerellaceae bacterium]